MAETAAAQAIEMVQPDETPAANMNWNDPYAGNLARDRDLAYAREASLEAIEEGEEEEYQQDQQEEERTPHAQGSIYLPELRGLQTVRLPVDHGMRSAWFPGRMAALPS